MRWRIVSRLWGSISRRNRPDARSTAKDRYLGPWVSNPARVAYERLIGEWSTNSGAGKAAERGCGIGARVSEVCEHVLCNFEPRSRADSPRPPSPGRELRP